MSITSSNIKISPLVSTPNDGSVNNTIESAILSSTVHDVRNVLSGIVGVNGIINDKLLELDGDIEELQELLEVVNRSSGDLLEFLNDLLKASSSRTIFSEKETINVVEILEKAVKLSSPNAIKSKIKIVRNIQDDIPHIAIISCKLLQVIINLIDNAIKYSPQDTQIILGVKKEEESVHITVKDQGYGMSEDQVNKILNKDNMMTKEQIYDKLHHSTSSFGIGFSSISEIVRVMDGELRIDSKVNLGTEVSVILPII